MAAPAAVAWLIHPQHRHQHLQIAMRGTQWRHARHSETRLSRFAFLASAGAAAVLVLTLNELSRATLQHSAAGLLDASAERERARAFDHADDAAECAPPEPPWQRAVPPFQHPELGVCGNWQEGYKQLHADILAGRAPQRYVVVGGISGLADGLVGAMTAFIHALLTGRAFQMRMEFDGPHWEWGYEARSINWSVPQPNPYPVITQTAYNMDYPQYDANNSIAYFRLFWLMPINATETLKGGNIDSLAAGYRTIYWQAGSGFIWNIFENPYALERLRSMGLQPATAFGCALQFLLQPNAEVRELFAPEAAALADEEALKIGVQIRLGDNKMLGGDGELEKDTVAVWLRCAQAVERSRKTQEGQRVLYYIISDSLKAREYAREFLGEDKVFTQTSRQVEHIIGHIYKGEAEDAVEHKRQVYLITVGENWAFGLTDFQVHNADSAYGKTGALRGLRPRSQYQIHDGGTPRECAIHNADSFFALADSFSRI